MNRRTTQRLSLFGGSAAIITALTAAALMDNHETGPEFDPTRPAAVSDVCEPTTDISDFTARTGHQRLVIHVPISLRAGYLTKTRTIRTVRV